MSEKDSDIYNYGRRVGYHTADEDEEEDEGNRTLGNTTLCESTLEDEKLYTPINKDKYNK